MPFESPANLLAPFLRDFNFNQLPSNWENSISEFYQQIYEANKKVNLTRIISYTDFLYKHIADSLLIKAAFSEIDNRNLKVIDVGCGGGIPGIPLAITFPKLSLMEIDSKKKKITAVDSMIRGLALENCFSIAGRAGELSRNKKFKFQYDVAIARAVKSADYLIDECRFFLKPKNGILVLYKTPLGIERERAVAIAECRKFDFEIRESPIFSLPENLGKRQFFLITNC